MSLRGSPIDNEYDPLMYGIQQVEGIDYETLSLFTSTTDKACLRDLLNSKSFVGEVEKVIKEFLSDWPYSGLLWLIHKLTLLNNQTIYIYSNSIYCY